MTTKHTTSTPAGAPRSRSRYTRATRKYLIAEFGFSRRPTIKQQMRDIRREIESDDGASLERARATFEAALGEWPKESPNA